MNQTDFNRAGARVLQLEAAIRKHRDVTTGQGMCWENDRELWRTLNEKDGVDHTPPGWFSFLWNCLRYRWGRRGCRRGSCAQGGAEPTPKPART